MWKGIGVNYKAAVASWPADAAYFNSIGLKDIRPHAPGMTIPYSSATNLSWRQCAQYFKNAGFWVVWGETWDKLTYGVLTATNWQDYRTAVLAQASHLMSIGFIPSIFDIGNELENKVDGDTLTIPQVRANIRQLATDVRNAGYTGKIGYAIGWGDNDNYNGWNAEGKGGLDFIALHPYGRVVNNGASVRDTYTTAINNFAAAFGDSGYISEFHLDDDWTRLSTLTPEAADFGMRKMYRAIRNSGIKRAMVFQWCGWQNLNNQYAMKNMDGSFAPSWDILLNNNGRRTFI